MNKNVLTCYFTFSSTGKGLHSDAFEESSICRAELVSGLLQNIFSGRMPAGLFRSSHRQDLAKFQDTGFRSDLFIPILASSLLSHSIVGIHGHCRVCR